MTMKKNHEVDPGKCKTDARSSSDYRRRIAPVIDSIIASCRNMRCHAAADEEQLPSREAAITILHRLRDVLFPGYFNSEKIDPVNLGFHVGRMVSDVFDVLAEQIRRGIRHDCFKYDLPCTDCTQRGFEHAVALLESIPELQDLLEKDVLATMDGDPAARSMDEIIFSYPGIFSVTVYRIANRLWRMGVPLLPRMMSEYVHGKTGIDIHPGAAIGERFVIDHGTGVVIGETAVIGNNVRIYQGVTIGALSVPAGHIAEIRGKKRHPTIEDDVIIYSGATILGGDTIIGARCVIGGNVWITSSVPADTSVMMESPRLIYRKQPNDESGAP
jgi:serine O-acetyltransferase